MKRRTFLQSAGTLAGGATLAARTNAATQSPDVLFIAVEDLKTSLSCYDNPVVQTPHIDSIADRGVLFANAACQYPLCNPSRSSLMSGLRPDSTKVYGNCEDWRAYLRNHTLLPAFFKDQGYDVLRCGKMFHKNTARTCKETPLLALDDTPYWTRIISEHEGFGRIPKMRPPTYLYDVPPEERERNYTTRAWTWGPTGRDDLEEQDGRLAEQGVRALMQKRDKPLFLALGFHRIHLPLYAPDKYFDMYNVDDIPLPYVPADALGQMPKEARYKLDDHREFTDAKRREAIRAYYACCSFIDAGIGRVLQALEDSGRADNTIIVFWGDHGYHLGEHGQWQKSTLFEEAVRVPLIISAPGVTPQGAVCNRPVELVDMYPTLAELCGFTPPDDLEGLSMKPVLRNPNLPWKKANFCQNGSQGRSLRTERWRYTEWGRPDRAELYDHENDPGELNNLAGNPVHKSIQNELRALMRGGWKAALPG